LFIYLGLFALVANGLAVGLLFYYEYPVNSWMSRKFLALTATACLFALLLSTWAFVRARSLPKKQLSYFGQNGVFLNWLHPILIMDVCNIKLVLILKYLSSSISVLLMLPIAY